MYSATEEATLLEILTIVIPKEVRDIFDINPGDSLIVLADSKKGIALVKSDVIEAATNNILGGSNDKDK